jgi:hypothetical protein
MPQAMINTQAPISMAQWLGVVRSARRNLTKSILRVTNLASSGVSLLIATFVVIHICQNDLLLP